MIAMKGIGRQSFLIVFDFDHTVIDCNSDVAIPQALGRGELLRTLAQTGEMQWTRVIDTVLAPFTAAEVTAAAAAQSVVIDPDMPAVFDYIRSLQREYNYSEKLSDARPPHTNTQDDTQDVVEGGEDAVPDMFEVDIVSDANTLFIEAILAAHLPAAQAAVSQIHSNPFFQSVTPPSPATQATAAAPRTNVPNRSAEDEAARDAAYNAGRTRRSRIGWYEPAGHDCPLCNRGGCPNMCKSRILHRLLATTRLIDPTIIYVGDGGNDYCPVTNVLRPRDHVLVRRGMTLHRVLAGEAMPFKVAEHAADACDSHAAKLAPCALSSVGGCCSVGLWSSARELLCLLRTRLAGGGDAGAVPRLPTLVRMRDVGAKEFRSITMNRRIPAVLQRTFDQNKAALVNCSRNMVGHDESGDGAGSVNPVEVGGGWDGLLQKLMGSAMRNEAVPRLPGQSCLPACWRNYAYTTEFDKCVAHPCQRAVVDHDALPTSPPRATHCLRRNSDESAGGGDSAEEGHRYRRVTPRWGQLPWLHGEIYFYHLLWQYLQQQQQQQQQQNQQNQQTVSSSRMPHPDPAGQTASTTTTPVEPNLISIYATLNPLYSQDCQVTRVQPQQDIQTSHRPTMGHVPYQHWPTCDTFLAHDEPQNYAHGVVVYHPSPDTRPQSHDRGSGRNGEGLHDKAACDGSSACASARRQRIPYTALADASGSYLIPASAQVAEDGNHTSRTCTQAGMFIPYRDVFAHEKDSLLRNFIDMRVLPMLACEPWAAGVDFAPVLLRWCLWANGLDLSMFTLDQLSAMHGGGDTGDAVGQKEAADAQHNRVHHAGKDKDHDSQDDAVRRWRAVEQRATMQQDAMLVGDCAADAARCLQCVVERAQRCRVPPTRATGAEESASMHVPASTITNTTHNDAKATEHTMQPTRCGERGATELNDTWVNRIDIVMDNVGVECVADLCLGLWFIEQAAHPTVPPCVTYHVKSMPYYVSDVTPRDMDVTLATLEQLYACPADDSEQDSPAGDAKKNNRDNSSLADRERRAMRRRIVAPFVDRVRAAFRSGAFQLDADAVWTQPSEYRELPPRILNRYFYTQYITPSTDEPAPLPPTSCAATAASAYTAEAAMRTACDVYRANKCRICPYSALVIFKGDLNYRRLIGDRYWNRTDFLSTLTDSDDLRHMESELSVEQRAIVDELLQDTPESAVMDGPSFSEVVSSFWPTHVVPVCAIRTIKSECCVGVPGDTKSRLDQTVGKQWRLTVCLDDAKVSVEIPSNQKQNRPAHEAEQIIHAPTMAEPV